MFLFFAMSSGEFTIFTGKKRTASLLCSHVYNSGIPAANVVGEKPSNSVPFLFVTFPA